MNPQLNTAQGHASIPQIFSYCFGPWAKLSPFSPFLCHFWATDLKLIWILCSTYHAFNSSRSSFDRGALGGVAVAEAVSTDNHVIEGVVVLLLHLITGVEQVVAQRVELDELHPEVSDLQHVCTHTEAKNSAHWHFSSGSDLKGSAAGSSHSPQHIVNVRQLHVCVSLSVGDAQLLPHVKFHTAL